MMYHSENLARVYAGDCRHMTDLEDNSVHCVVTSPPYFGLRRYKGLEDLVLGGRSDCQHEWGPERTINRGHPGKLSTLVGTQTATLSKEAGNQGAYCQLCDAWRGQLGGEPTIELFIAHLVEVFKEVKRVLRPDGVCWVNIGDSMAGSGHGKTDRATCKEVFPDDEIQGYQKPTDGLKNLDACLIPFRLALALQADGWYVREDIIWSKNNPMPESLNGWRWEKHRIKVKNNGRSQGNRRSEGIGTDEHPVQNHSGYTWFPDAIFEDCPGCLKCQPNNGLVLRQGNWRPTNAHEYIFMLTKSDNYYADREAVKEAYTKPLDHGKAIVPK